MFLSTDSVRPIFFINSFFSSLWIIFSCFFVCLVVYFLDARDCEFCFGGSEHFCIPVNVLDLFCFFKYGRFTVVCVILAQGSCESSPYRSGFGVCAVEASTTLSPCSATDKLLGNSLVLGDPSPAIRGRTRAVCSPG